MLIKKAGRRGSSISWSRRLVPYLFVAPNLAIFLTFIIWPAIRGFWISFFDSNDGVHFKYVGNANFKEILHDPTISQVARNTITYVFFYVLLAITISIALALVVNEQKFAKSFFRAILFMPVMLSPVVVGLIWSDIVDRKHGPLNAAIKMLGGGSPGWLVDTNLGMVTVVFVGLWVHVGFYSIILLAGLQGIDRSVLEAASIDGASRMQTIRQIILPLLKPTTLVIVILATIHGFQSFDFIYTLTGGGPLGATTLIVQYIYERAFGVPIRYGLGSAAGVILFLVIFAFTAMNFIAGRRRNAV